MPALGEQLDHGAFGEQGRIDVPYAPDAIDVVFSLRPGSPGDCLDYDLHLQLDCALVVGISPGAPTTLDDLVAAVQPGVTGVTYAWTVDDGGEPVDGDTVPADRTTRGQTWTVVATTDEDPPRQATAAVVVGNAPPIVDVSFVPYDATGTGACAIPRCRADVVDPDGDLLHDDWAWGAYFYGAVFDWGQVFSWTRPGATWVGEVYGCGAGRYDVLGAEGWGEASVTIADATMADGDDDGICDAADACVGNDAIGDSDGDGVCDDSDGCLGDDHTGDTDHDGVCDDQDACLGRDAAGDADADGTCDDLDPCYGDQAAGDVDADGLCADEEATQGSVDTDPDTDDDRLSDLQELLHGSDPTDPDSDGGGVRDGWEVGVSRDPLDPADDAEIRLVFATSTVHRGDFGGLWGRLPAGDVAVRRRRLRAARRRAGGLERGGPVRPPLRRLHDHGRARPADHLRVGLRVDRLPGRVAGDHRERHVQGLDVVRALGRRLDRSGGPGRPGRGPGHVAVRAHADVLRDVAAPPLRPGRRRRRRRARRVGRGRRRHGSERPRRGRRRAARRRRVRARRGPVRHRHRPRRPARRRGGRARHEPRGRRHRPRRRRRRGRARPRHRSARPRHRPRRPARRRGARPARRPVRSGLRRRWAARRRGGHAPRGSARRRHRRRPPPRRRRGRARHRSHEGRHRRRREGRRRRARPRPRPARPRRRLTYERCGDGQHGLGEACDDGDALNGTYGFCAAGCATLGERCGDGAINGPEDCDGADLAGVPCTAACRLTPCPRPATEDLDVTIPPVTGMGGYQASMSLAQSLTVGRTGLLTKLRFWTQSLGSDTTCFRVEVRDGTGGPLLGAQDVCVPAIFGTLPNAVVATFDVPVPLAAGQAVTIGFVPTSGGASIAVLWRSTDAYAGGTALVGGYPYPADFALDTWVADPGGCAATCGDGVVQSIEGCDEGDTVAGDGCSDHCDEEACGDGIVQPDLGEACDDGLANGDHGACAPDCSGPGDACGDGVLNGDEACDWGDANVPGVGVCTDQCLCHGDPVAQVEVLPDGSGGFVAQAGGQDLVQGVVPTADGLLTTWSFPTTPFQTGTSCLRFAILEDALGAYGSLAETVRCWDQVYGSGTTWATVDLDPPLAVAAGVPRTVRVRHESGVAMQLLRADGSYRVSNVDAGLAFHAWVAPYEDCPAP